MRDALFLAVIVGFFATAAAYVRACARIIGPDEMSSDVEQDSENPSNADEATSQ